MSEGSTSDRERLEALANVSRRGLVGSTVAFEGALLLFGALVVWLTGLQPGLDWSCLALVTGGLVGVVLAAAAIAVAYSRAPWFERIRKDFALFIKLFERCSAADLALVSLLAGIGEEMLFRGLLQTWLTTVAGPHVAILVAAVAFGLAHAISRQYVLFATALGIVLGYTYLLTGSLPAAMLAHAVYDFVALLWGVSRSRSQATGAQPEV